MALTLECVCGNADAYLCTLEQLVWVVEVETEAKGVSSLLGIPLFSYNRLSLESSDHDHRVEMVAPATGSYRFDLTPVGEWIALWSSLYIWLWDAHSAYIGFGRPFYSAFFRFAASFHIEQHYRCQNLLTDEVTHRVVIAVPSGSGDCLCIEPGTDKIVDKCKSSGNAVSSITYASSPFILCWGCNSTLSPTIDGCNGVTTGSFQPPPEPNTFDVRNSGFCLCPKGGTGAYTFSIVSGNLPCGQTLNRDTGCIEGDADGTCPGSDAITFRVTDLGGAAVGPTGGETTIGTCRTFGVGVTRITGPGWTSEMVGHSIAINGSTYTIASVEGASNLTLVEIAGIHDPVNWAYTSPVVPPPTPAPPETAEVTCGFLGNGECRDDGTRNAVY